MPQINIKRGYQHLEAFNVADGITVRQIVRDRYPETGEWPTPTICLLDGQPLLRQNEGWESAVLRGGCKVTFIKLRWIDKFWSKHPLLGDIFNCLCLLTMAGLGIFMLVIMMKIFLS